jgi:hypothetical protein
VGARASDLPPTFEFGRRRTLNATAVFDTYWRYAALRQSLFMARVDGAPPPWTDDVVLASHRFTNVYRASDRVSQYLIRHVIYNGEPDDESTFFRILLFKIFNRIDTWELLEEELGRIRWPHFDFDRCRSVLDKALRKGRRIYSAAYIMPSPQFGSARKHRNHLMLLEHMMRDGAPRKVVNARSLSEVFEVLVSYPSIGKFLAFQFAIDLNYSELVDFSEMDFVVAGPGARSGISKCFVDMDGLTPEYLIRVVTEMAEAQFLKRGLTFATLWGRPLQLIDCQNVFCEVDKYARVVHPDVRGASNRTRIKQLYRPTSNNVPQWYPPKWGLQATHGSVQPREVIGPTAR